MTQKPLSGLFLYWESFLVLSLSSPISLTARKKTGMMINGFLCPFAAMRKANYPARNCKSFHKGFVFWQSILPYQKNALYRRFS